LQQRQRLRTEHRGEPWHADRSAVVNQFGEPRERRLGLLVERSHRPALRAPRRVIMSSILYAWSFTKSPPARLAASMSAFARPILPLWLLEISATNRH